MKWQVKQYTGWSIEPVSDLFDTPEEAMAEMERLKKKRAEWPDYVKRIFRLEIEKVRG